MQLFINNWSAVLTASATAEAGSLFVSEAEAAKLIGLEVLGDYYALTLAEIGETGEELREEIVRCTMVAGGSLAVTRGQEGTAAQVWDVGTVIEARLTKETMETLRDAAGGGAPLSDDDPAALGPVNPGASSEASRSDHMHPLPTPADIGAATAAQGAAADAAIPLAQKGAASGVAPLDAGAKIALIHLPATAITSTFVVNTEAAMLALSAQEGDVAIRPDISTSFILQAEPASTLANWQELLSPGSGGGAPVGSATPQPLGAASPGVSTSASRQDHVHDMPDAADVGADPAGAAAAAQAHAVQRGNHTGTQAASTISDFSSTARAQIEAALVAGANITITPSGSGATRQLTIAATGGSSATATQSASSSGGVLDLSATTAAVVLVTLTENVNSITLPAGVAGQSIERRIVFTQGGAGTYTLPTSTVSWGSITVEAGEAIPQVRAGVGSVTSYVLANDNSVGWRMYLDQAGGHNFRNKIINGKMGVAQRGTSFPTPTPGVPNIDRWSLEKTSAGVVSIDQSTDVPPSNEFQFSLRATVTTADNTVDTGDVVLFRQRLEGYDIRDLVGRTFTFSFWVRSSKTGIHCVAFKNQPTPDRSFVAEYTINAANTWEKKAITVAGGLTSAGTWNYTNGIGLQVDFALMSGSTFQTTAGAWQTGNLQCTSAQVNVMDTVGNIFAITGVQLEPGGVATPFEHRLIGTEVSLCQRYFQKSFPLATAPAEGAYSGWLPGFAWSATGLGVGQLLFPVRMRAAPSVTFYRPSVSASPSGQWAWFNGTSYIASTTTLADGVAQEFGLSVTMTSSGATFGQAYIVRGNWTANAEL